MFAKESKTAAAYPAFIKEKTKVVAMNRVYSNRMEDSVKTFCWECDQAISLSGLTKHLRGVHKKSVVDYREMYGEPKKQLLRLVHHKCGVCQEAILLDHLVLVPRMHGTWLPSLSKICRLEECHYVDVLRILQNSSTRKSRVDKTAL